MLPVCRSYLLDHGGPSDSVVLLLHGMTNCPLQFEAFGRRLHAAGHTVLVPRLPRNGLADRRTDALGGLRAAEMAALGDEAVDIAVGLGRRVTVFGLSAGGLVAAWVAQHRPEAARVIIAAPFCGVVWTVTIGVVLSANFPEEAAAPRVVIVAVALGYIPLLFAFLAFIPDLGPAILVLLQGLSLLTTTVAISVGYGLPFSQAALSTIGGWLVFQAVGHQPGLAQRVDPAALGGAHPAVAQPLAVLFLPRLVELVQAVADNEQAGQPDQPAAEGQAHVS